MRFAADENFNNDILRGLLRARPAMDLVRLQDTNLVGADDPRVLEWCATEGRVLLTHDVTTMTRYAYDRLRANQPMPGVFEVPRGVSIAAVLADLLVIDECSLEDEWEGRVEYLPLR